MSVNNEENENRSKEKEEMEKLAKEKEKQERIKRIGQMKNILKEMIDNERRRGEQYKNFSKKLKKLQDQDNYASFLSREEKETLDWMLEKQKSWKFYEHSARIINEIQETLIGSAYGDLERWLSDPVNDQKIVLEEAKLMKCASLIAKAFDPTDTKNKPYLAAAKESIFFLDVFRDFENAMLERTKKSDKFRKIYIDSVQTVSGDPKEDMGSLAQFSSVAFQKLMRDNMTFGNFVEKASSITSNNSDVSEIGSADKTLNGVAENANLLKSKFERFEKEMIHLGKATIEETEVLAKVVYLFNPENIVTPEEALASMRKLKSDFSHNSRVVEFLDQKIKMMDAEFKIKTKIQEDDIKNESQKLLEEFKGVRKKSKDTEKISEISKDAIHRMAFYRVAYKEDLSGKSLSDLRKYMAFLQALKGSLEEAGKNKSDIVKFLDIEIKAKLLEVTKAQAPAQQVPALAPTQPQVSSADRGSAANKAKNVKATGVATILKDTRMIPITKKTNEGSEPAAPPAVTLAKDSAVQEVRKLPNMPQHPTKLAKQLPKPVRRNSP